MFYAEFLSIFSVLKIELCFTGWIVQDPNHLRRGRRDGRGRNLGPQGDGLHLQGLQLQSYSGARGSNPFNPNDNVQMDFFVPLSGGYTYRQQIFGYFVT